MSAWLVITVATCAGDMARDLVEEILETAAEDMHAEATAAELLEGAVAEGSAMSEDSHQSNEEEGSEDGMESDVITDEEGVLDEDGYNSAGEEVSE